MVLEILRTNCNYFIQKASEYVPVAKVQAYVIAKKIEGHVASIAHGALHVTAEAADLASKSCIIAGPFLGAFLIGDTFAYRNGHALFLNECGEKATLALENRGLVNIKQQNDGSILRSCQNPSQMEIDTFINRQIVLGLTVLFVATPIAAMAFHKIEKLAIKANQAF